MDISRITAILVLYQTPPAESLTLQSLNKACVAAGTSLDVYVYDNSPQPQPRGEFSNLHIREQKHDPSNPGVSAAYKFFVTSLAPKPSAWLLFLDQDTEFPEDFITKLQSLSPEQACALILPRLMQDNTQISPHPLRFGYSYPEKALEEGVQSLKTRSALNSGILVRAKAYYQAGGYAEDVPLYFSDQVFIHRLKKTGVNRFYQLDATCRHSMSSNDQRDMRDFKKRFRYFVEGARQARRHFGPLTRLGLSGVVSMRALKLSLLLKDFFYLQQLTK